MRCMRHERGEVHVGQCGVSGSGRCDRRMPVPGVRTVTEQLLWRAVLSRQAGAEAFLLACGAVTHSGHRVHCEDISRTVKARRSARRQRPQTLQQTLPGFRPWGLSAGRCTVFEAFVRRQQRSTHEAWPSESHQLVCGVQWLASELGTVVLRSIQRNVWSPRHVYYARCWCQPLCVRCGRVPNSEPSVAA